MSARSAEASLSIVGGAPAPSTDLSDPQAESPLSQVSEAYAYLEDCRERAERAKSILVEIVRDAREAGETVRGIAAAMGVTRQYVQKLVRELERGEELDRLEAARYEPDAARRTLGKTGGYARPQCGGCKRFLKAHGAQCPSCGYLDGGGYFAVPAQTTHLERWH